MEENNTTTEERKKLYEGYLTIEDYEGKEVVKHPNTIGAIIFDTIKKKYIFVEQTRPAAEGKTLEICAGKIDKGEEVEEALKREIVEETGYKVDIINHIYDYYTAVGYSTEIMSLFYVEVSEKVGEGGGIDSEDISLVEVDKLGFGGNLLFEGGEGEMVPPYRLVDAKSIMAVNHVEHNRIMKDTIDVLTGGKIREF
jgi:ADP-ribose pyrophosphatase